MLFFGVCFFLYFIKLSAGKGYYNYDFQKNTPVAAKHSLYLYGLYNGETIKHSYYHFTLKMTSQLRLRQGKNHRISGPTVHKADFIICSNMVLDICGSKKCVVMCQKRDVCRSVVGKMPHLSKDQKIWLCLENAMLKELNGCRWENLAVPTEQTTARTL